MVIQATNKFTGEVIEMPADTLNAVASAWKLAQEYERVAISLKDQLKKIVPTLVNTDGKSEPTGNYMFRVSNIQRMNYDKALLRDSLDPDLYDVLVIPNKVAVDQYIKEHLEELGEVSTALRKGMIPQGQPYQVIKLERIKRDED